MAGRAASPATLPPRTAKGSWWRHSPDFSTCGDLYTHRATIAALLAPWFSRCTVADLAVAFAGTSVSWARLHNLTGRPGAMPPVLLNPVPGGVPGGLDRGVLRGRCRSA